MSNQRAGKTHRAAMSDGLGEMKMRNFFRDCKEILESSDEDAAFYFEQIMDELNAGKPLPTEKREVARLLGV